MALSLGTLFVKLSADPSELQAKLEASAAKVKKFADGFDKAAKEVGKVGLALTALGGASIRTAAQFDSGVKKATDDLSNTYNNLAVEIGRMLIPAIEAINKGLTIVFNVIKNMSPEMKSFVGVFGALAAGMMTAAPLFGKLVQGFSGMYSMVTKLIPMLAGLSAPVLIFIAAIAAVVAAIPLLWQAWEDNVGGIQEITGEVIDWIVKAWKWLTDKLGPIFSWIGEAFNNVMKFAYQAFKLFASKVISGWNEISKMLGGPDFTNEINAFWATMDAAFSDGYKSLVPMAVDAFDKSFAYAKRAYTNFGAMLKEKVGGAFKDIMALGDQAAPKLNSLADGQKNIAEAALAGLKAEEERLDLLDAERKKMEEIAAASWDAYKADQARMGIGVTGQQGRVGGVSTAVMSEKDKAANEARMRQVESQPQAMQQIGEQALGSIGKLGGIVSTFANTLSMTGDPMIAAIAALVALLPSLKGFDVVLNAADEVFGVLVTTLGDTMMPLFVAVAMIFKSLAKVLEILMAVLGPVLNFIFKIIATVVGGVMIAGAAIVRGLMWAVGWLLDTLADLIGWLLGDQADWLRNTANNIRSSMPDPNDLGKMIEDMWNDNYGPDIANKFDAGMKPVEISAGNAAEALDKLTESLTNVPAGFKIAAARFNAMGPEGYEIMPGSLGQRPLNIIMDGRTLAMVQAGLASSATWGQMGIGSPP